MDVNNESLKQYGINGRCDNVRSCSNPWFAFDTGVRGGIGGENCLQSMIMRKAVILRKK